MPFHNGEVLGQEGTHGRIPTVWFHWAACVRVVVPGVLRTCRTRIFCRSGRNISGVQADVEGCDKTKKAVGSTICMCKPCIGFFETQCFFFWCGACVVCSSCSFSCVVVLSLVFASVAPVALMSFSCLRVGLAQAQRAGLMLLPSWKKHMQVTSISGMLQQEDVQLASCPTSKFSCVITVSIPRPAGVKHDWEHTSKTVISLTVDHRIVYESTFFAREQFEQGNRSALTWWRQRHHPCFCCICEPMETAQSFGDDTLVVVTRPKGRESTDYALVWSLVSVVGKPGPSMGARTRTVGRSEGETLTFQ